jgi:nucleotide-binding universal stress UspA family protein
MIKDLVVHVPLEPSHERTVAYAVSVAAACDAHLTGTAFAYEPVLPPFDGVAAISAEWIEGQIADAADRANMAIAQFEKLGQASGISVAGRVLRASAVGASVTFGEAARRFDLSIVGQPEESEREYESLFVEAALFQSGRPLLVVPYIHKAPFSLDRVLVCWDGSSHAARAVADAMPLLRKAGETTLLTITKDVKSDELPAADIGQHLARHGIRVEVKRIALSDSEVAGLILSYAADAGSDLIVMGGYGHSRFRELVLGGATRGMLRAMTVPTLMSH